MDDNYFLKKEKFPDLNHLTEKQYENFSKVIKDLKSIERIDIFQNGHCYLAVISRNDGSFNIVEAEKDKTKHYRNPGELEKNLVKNLVEWKKIGLKSKIKNLREC